MKKFKVFGETAESGGNLMGLVQEPANPLDSGVPVTVLREESDVADVRFRFFYPDSLEAPICGHALLGAASHIDKERFTAETAAGLYRIKKQGNGMIFARFGQHEMIEPNFDGEPDPVWFGLEQGEIFVRGVFSGSKPKLCLEVADLGTLKRIVCDLERLKVWNEGKNFSGYVVYTETDEGVVYARAMNPLYNIGEDAACAVCCAALPIRRPRYRVVMGFPDFLNGIQVENQGDVIWIGGRVFPAA